MVHHILKEEIREQHDRNIIMERTQEAMVNMNIHTLYQLYDEYIARDYTEGDVD